MAATGRETLQARLRRFPADRYPVQHATAQFHLGSQQLHAGNAGDAVSALTTAARLFAAAGLVLERGKSELMLGIALRCADRPAEAAAVLQRAEAALAGVGATAERGAAAYNLALVHRDRGEDEAACRAWERAAELLLAAGQPRPAAAALRDRGSTLLASGRPEQALAPLQRAAELADQVAEPADVGSAGNVLGLAQLAVGDATAAVTTLRRALGGFARSVRPAEHAMVKANLALAYERCGDAARARLAAAQALAIGPAAPAVRQQAQQLLGRLTGGDDLWQALDRDPPPDWVDEVREELLRALDLDPAGRHAVVRGFLDGLLSRDATATGLAQSFLTVLLELAPTPYGELVESVVVGCAGRPPEATERLQAVLGSAMARFALPQWQRLVACLNSTASAVGAPPTWR